MHTTTTNQATFQKNDSRRTDMGLASYGDWGTVGSDLGQSRDCLRTGLATSFFFPHPLSHAGLYACARAYKRVWVKEERSSVNTYICVSW